MGHHPHACGVRTFVIAVTVVARSSAQVRCGLKVVRLIAVGVLIVSNNMTTSHPKWKASPLRRGKRRMSRVLKLWDLARACPHRSNGTCDIFTCTLVSCVAVSSLHLRTLPQAVESQAKRCFHIGHHIGLHRLAHCALQHTVWINEIMADATAADPSVGVWGATRLFLLLLGVSRRRAGLAPAWRRTVKGPSPSSLLPPRPSLAKKKQWRCSHTPTEGLADFMGFQSEARGSRRNQQTVTSASPTD